MEEVLNSEHETELNLFEGMDGFEKFNPLDDTSLLAILDDLEEGTLLSLLGDESLVSEVSSEINNKSLPVMTMEPVSQEREIEELCATLLNEELPPTNDDKPASPSTQTETEDTISKPSNTMKRPLPDSPLESPLKRAKLDTEDLLSSVHHDHSYAAAPACHVTNCHVTSEEMSKSQRTSAGSSSDEEGSLSDAGYDTMSSSTSPGNNSSGVSPPLPPPAPLSSLPEALKRDPVALIDARIQQYMRSREVNLTEEEKETLKAEGLPIPTTLPLTKTEEKALRGVRRKIKNKMAAQESRKRKKIEQSLLEEKCKQYCTDNLQLKKEVETLSVENKTLRAELNKFKELFSSQTGTSKAPRVGACMMVIVLCFAVFFGSLTPHNLWSRSKDYSTSSVRSRSLLSLEDSWFQTLTPDWLQDVLISHTLGQDTPSSHPPSSCEDHPPLLHGPLSYYQHVYYQFSGYLNSTVAHSRSFAETNKHFAC